MGTVYKDKPVPVNMGPGETMVQENGGWVKVSKEEAEKRWVAGEVSLVETREQVNAGLADGLFTMGGFVLAAGLLVVPAAPITVPMLGAAAAAAAAGWIAGDLIQGLLTSGPEKMEGLKAARLEEAVAELKKRRETDARVDAELGRQGLSADAGRGPAAR